MGLMFLDCTTKVNSKFYHDQKLQQNYLVIEPSQRQLLQQLVKALEVVRNMQQEAAVSGYIVYGPG